MVGRKFGLLTVTSRGADYITPSTGKRSKRWICRCDCGAETISSQSHLRGARSRSCGCVRIKIATKHRLSETPEYRIWATMKHRCRATKDPQKNLYYTARGISVCERWHKFESFIADMGMRPTPQHTVERMDNSLGYSPENCEWRLPAEQARNRRKPSTNTSGIMGVHFQKRDQNWLAFIGIGGKMIRLGSFVEFDSAVAARKAAEERYGFTCGLGKNDQPGAAP